eukprot:1739370-Amphidinium_carterae.1
MEVRQKWNSVRIRLWVTLYVLISGERRSTGIRGTVRASVEGSGADCNVSSPSWSKVCSMTGRWDDKGASTTSSLVEEAG